MSKSIQITCDNCQRDITYGSGYRVALTSEALGPSPANWGAATMDVYWENPVRFPRHFCDTGCLSRWLAPSPPSEAESIVRKVIGPS